MSNTTGILADFAQENRNEIDSDMGKLLQSIESLHRKFEELRHIPRDIIALMKCAGLFRAATPARFGGTGLPAADFLRKIETIATVDGSAAWVAAFGSANTYLAALPEETQARIYASGPDQVYAGGLYPLHKARRVDGGIVVSGRWKFASGCMGADWIGVGIALDEPLFPDDANTTTYMAVCPASEVKIIESWDVVGMEATGSHDTQVHEKFYPLEWICARGAPAIFDEPIYRYPTLAYQAQVHAAVNIGLARKALDTVTAMSGAAKIMPGASRLCDRSYYRLELAKGEAKWRAARAFYYEAAEQAWTEVTSRGVCSYGQTNLLRLSATHAAHCSAEVIQSAFRIAGIAAIQKSHILQKIVRDAMVVTQHAALNEGTFDSSGAVFAGLAPGAQFP